MAWELSEKTAGCQSDLAASYMYILIIIYHPGAPGSQIHSKHDLDPGQSASCSTKPWCASPLAASRAILQIAGSSRATPMGDAPHGGFPQWGISGIPHGAFPYAIGGFPNWANPPWRILPLDQFPNTWTYCRVRESITFRMRLPAGWQLPSQDDSDHE